MSRNATVPLALSILVCAGPSFARADLNHEAVEQAVSALALTHSTTCRSSTNRWQQWKFVTRERSPSWFQPGFVQVLPQPHQHNAAYYVEATQLTGPYVTANRITLADQLNGLEWSGVVSWSAGAYRTYSTGTMGAPVWQRGGTVFQVGLAKYSGKPWSVQSSSPNGTAVDHTCVDVAALGQHARSDYEKRAHELNEQQRRQMEAWNRTHPVAPHRRDPYYTPQKSTRRGSECVPGAGRACY